MRQRLFVLACGAASLAGLSCLDALYEDAPPSNPAGGWVVCCLAGHINTCPCDAGSGCATELLACYAGTCAPRAGSCGGGGGDGGVIGSDGGSPPGDGGADAGSSGDGGSDGGTTVTTYQPCCTPAGLVSTCACAATGCDGGTFTACQYGRCVQSGACP